MIFESTPTVIGHRGHGSGAPIPPSAAGPVAENTLPSLLAAVAAGLSWVEIDVTRTADDDLVLRHDPTMPDGEHLVELTAAASGLPRLADIFDALPPDVAVDVDVKTVLADAVDDPSRRTGALLLPVLRQEAKRRRLLVTSFDPSLLTFLRDELPGVPLGLLTWLRFPLWHAIPAAAGLGLDAVAVHTASCGLEHPDTRLPPLEQCVDAAHKAGLETVVWCPTAETAPDYAAAGFDAMVVNDVPGVLTAL
ncbi:glycerophosphodiester phosphodiesterase [Actinomadura meridiana]|uniref:Glycerophosphodiester phosphodiesterase n=1 Tax=Actinomadura meridiana TaxID=559626 RepID=A0ABP8C8F3_9ACTN